MNAAPFALGTVDGAGGRFARDDLMHDGGLGGDVLVLGLCQRQHLCNQTEALRKHPTSPACLLTLLLTKKRHVS